MEQCDRNTGSSNTGNDGGSSSSMSNVLKVLNAAFSIPNKPVESLPPQLVMVGAKLRPGLSARDIASKVISRQSEAGAPVGDIFSENANIMETMTVILVEEIVSALQLDAKIEIVVPPGVQVITTGLGNMGGPVISQGATTNMGVGEGVIR
tara:strand:- start:255 stop:707 length:453 start_codon:yes stop_codon:yes gene_type:complete